MNENYWGAKNNTSLPELNAKSLVRNLKERYQKAYGHQGHEGEGSGGSGIYTWTGTVLLAVNPYQRLNVYGDTQVDHHFSKTITQADPHPFGIASHAFQTLNKSKSAQSIVVSGESGAGKTETAKFVMRFLSTIGRSTSGDSLAEFLESTNPILEAYGNAKTCRNENSSRFGKVMKLFYTQSGASHKLVSAAVETYLLARSRVTHTPLNERNYHVFYLLTNGGVEKQLPELAPYVKPASFFTYLASSASVQSGYLSDSAFLADMLKAFTSLGVSRTEQVRLFELVLALLWMGNINLEAEDVKDSNGKCKISESSAEAVSIVAKILGISTGAGTDDHPSLEKLLTELKLSIGSNNKSSSSVWASTNAAKARTVRDAVVKRIYAKMFDYIVSVLNSKLARHLGSSNSDNNASLEEDNGRFISILDIFGFENLPSNGLEQLCINYANERLQNFFLRNVVISEAEEYSRECIPYPGVSPPDNGPVIKAIAGRNGIFDLLRKTTLDSMLRPLEGRDYDADFYVTLGASVATPSSAVGTGGLVRAIMRGGKGKHDPLASAFTVSHYAEEVQYLVEGFVESNKDSDTRVDFIVSHFKNELLQSCVGTSVPGSADFGATRASLVDTTNQQRRCIATAFSAQVDHLLEDHLERTRLHCIRCLKPNDLKKANHFDDERVGSQLRVSGMNEVLTLMAHSFPIRIPYLDLFNRYKPLLSDKILSELTRQTGEKRAGAVHGAAAKLFVQETIGLLEHGDGGAGLISGSEMKEGSDFQLGTSKVFFRLGKVEPLEKLLAACDKDKHYAQRVAELIGKRIMAKRKSRQLMFMRTSFKLLVIYRRRQNYWKWFRNYFIRLSFLVKACKTHFIPRMKARRIQRKRAVRLIQTAYAAHLERRRIAAKARIQAVFASFMVRADLSGKSRLANQMGASSELIQGAVLGYACQIRLTKLRAAEQERLRIEQMEALRVEVELQAKLAAEREAQLEREREEREQLRLAAEALAIEQKRLAAEQLEKSRIENEKLLISANGRISQLETECSSRVTEIESIKEDYSEQIRQVRANMDAQESESRAQIAQLSSELEARLVELKEVQTKYEQEVVVANAEHASDMARMDIQLREAGVAFESMKTDLESQLSEKSAAIESMATAHASEVESMTQSHASEMDRMHIQMHELEEGLKAELEGLKNQLSERIELYEYSKLQAQEELASMRSAHESEMEAAAATWRSAESSLNEKITQLMDQLDANLKLLERTKSNDAEIIDRLMNQHETDMAGVREELARTKYELESRLSDLVNSLSEKESELGAKASAYSTEIEHLKSSLSDELTFAQIRARESEEALTFRISELVVEVEAGLRLVDRIKSETQSEIAELRNGHETQLAAAAAELAFVRAETSASISGLSAKLAERERELSDEIDRLKSDNVQSILSQQTELATNFEAQLAQLTATQSILNAESAALLSEKEHELESARLQSNELRTELAELKQNHESDRARLQLAFDEEVQNSQVRLSTLEAEKTSLLAAESAKLAELDSLLTGLRAEISSDRAQFQMTLADREKQYEISLQAERGRLESLLTTSRAETAALTEQLESVVQEKAKLAVVASQSLMQGEKLKKDAEDQLKRERAEMERKIQNESSRLKRDFEIINRKTLEIKLFEVEELKQETQKRLQEAEKMRNDAVQMMQEIRRGTFDEEKENAKTIAVLPVEKEEVIQQAIHDYHNATDEYERTYVIERRRASVQQEKLIDSAKTNALEAKLQRTSVAAKQPGRKSLGNISNVALKTQATKEPESQPAAKLARLSSEMISRNNN